MSALDLAVWLYLIILPAVWALSVIVGLVFDICAERRRKS